MPDEKPAFRNEWLVIILLVLFFTWYVTFGSAFINKFIPKDILAIAWKTSIAVLLKKLLVFVLVPLLIYKTAGFSLKDFGFRISGNRLFSRETLLPFFILSVVVVLFQYYFSGGAEPIRKGQFAFRQLIITWPLLFLWLFIEAGLVEEFFFRAVLQSRIAAMLKSPAGGIVISSIIFGLAHAPGLYLRGAESEGISEQLPFHFWGAYTICYMSLAGLFLGIIRYRTNNIYLLMALHAMVDILPNTKEFIATWHI